LSPPAVPHGDRDGALRGILPDDVTIEFGDDLARRKFPELGLALDCRGWGLGGIRIQLRDSNSSTTIFVFV
jgi:hypothetical protein